MTVLGAKPALATGSSVFDVGCNIDKIIVKKPDAPKDLLIFTPTDEGTYPVVLFFHGFCISSTSYSLLLQHIASHGFIVIAPSDNRIFSLSVCCCGNEVESAATVIDWLPTGLVSVLPKKVKPDLLKLALGGHGRGGKIAFALALGKAQTDLKFSAVFGVDPVAGSSPNNRPDPKILTYIPRSFLLQIPVAVIGTGLGSKPKGLVPPFAPNGVNHAEFFNESKPPVYYFLAKDYGHSDMLDDGFDYSFAHFASNCGKGSKDLMTKGCGGLVVAFLYAKLLGNSQDLDAIGAQPSLAPINLDPVIYVETGRSLRDKHF